MICICKITLTGAKNKFFKTAVVAEHHLIIADVKNKESRKQLF